VPESAKATLQAEGLALKVCCCAKEMEATDSRRRRINDLAMVFISAPGEGELQMVN
jgi:hypothetical protein